MVNIQCTHPDPWLSAVAMDDKRVNKMTLETAQLYCTITGTPTYRPVHQNNPTTAWCEQNLNWLVEFHHALAGEYFYRFGKTHKSFVDVGQAMRSRGPAKPKFFRNGARTARTTDDGRPIDFTFIEDTHLAYRYYLRCRMMFDTKQPVWTRRPPPFWLDEANITDMPMIFSQDVHEHWLNPVQWRVVCTTMKKRTLQTSGRAKQATSIPLSMGTRRGTGSSRR